ncbi:MAG: DUF6461 domain-containing protein [Streptosporangiales bacterium]|nr:DUF6461 domain-containing protein [Streptosporangiales bacterium]
MTDVPAVPDEAVEALAASVAAVIPLLKSRIPAIPAAQLGRTSAPPAGPAGRSRPMPEPLLSERILGALELTIPALSLDSAPGLTLYLPEPPTRVGTARAAGESEVVASTRLLESFRPGAPDLARSLSRRLSPHPLIAPLLTAAPEQIPDGAAAEEAVAAAHGAGYLALGVAVAWAVVGRGPLLRGPALDIVAAAVGLGLASARELLAEAPMPEAYATARLAKVRAEYLLPRSASGQVQAEGHRFALTEGGFPDTADFSGNGLVAVVPGGAVIRTGAADGPVTVRVRVFAEEPESPQTESWDEVVDVSWHADEGLASVAGPGEDSRSSGPDDRRAAFRNQLRGVTPPWPGDYRLRVYVSGRDDPDDGERYELHVWQAPPAPEAVRKRTDRLGCQLRGEPDPDPRPQPWKKYREICKAVLDVHGTITVITGVSAAQVVRAFGGDPDRPEALSELESNEMDNFPSESSIAVLPTAASTGEPAAIVIEGLGFQGMYALEEASVHGRAASFHQNAKGMTNLAFAEGGEVLVSEEFPEPEEGGPAVEAAMEGMDFDDVRDYAEKCLYAMERFTGCVIPLDAPEQIRSADVGYRVPQ